MGIRPQQVLFSLLVSLSLSVSTSYAGSLYLTGHDLLAHSGQNGYDEVVLDFLRDGQDKSTYDIAVIGSGIGFWEFSNNSQFASGYASTTFYDPLTADWSEVLSKDLMIVLSHTSCGGCDLSDLGSLLLNLQADAIATAFNGGMDILGLSGAHSNSYYDFLPPGAAVSGVSELGDSGFSLTADGVAIGLTDTPPNSMINGFLTHNGFVDFDSDFMVFEEMSGMAVSVGLRSGMIIDGDFVADIDPPTQVSEPVTLSILIAGCVVLARRRRNV